MTGTTLSALAPQEPDKIIRLMAQFAADPRADKVDLGVGVYRAVDGTTPILPSVLAAEARIAAKQVTKGYVALEGDPAFHAAMGELVLGPQYSPDTVAAVATPGGTGAVRQGLELIARANPDVTVWVPDPSWPNHAAILEAMSLPRRDYRYYNAETGGVDVDGMLRDLSGAKQGDIILLHGCCHNPTGADLSLDAWQALSQLCQQTGAVPLVDLAYLGFGEGVDADAAGLRAMAANVPEMMIAVSGSKNFGLYRERVGLVMACCPNSDVKARAAGMLSWLNRLNFAFPPDHGARAVTEILTDPELRTMWLGDLEEMRTRINDMRAALATALGSATQSDRFDFLTTQRGMFSLIGATPQQVEHLRDAYGVYMVGDGRINLAGLTQATIPVVADAIAASIH